MRPHMSASILGAAEGSTGDRSPLLFGDSWVTDRHGGTLTRRPDATRTWRVPCPGFARIDPWIGVLGAFLGILGLAELPGVTATSPPNTPRQLGHPLRFT